MWRDREECVKIERGTPVRKSLEFKNLILVMLIVVNILGKFLE